MDKPPHLTELKPLTPDEEKEFKREMGEERDTQTAIMQEARKMRTDLRLESRVRYTSFLQKLGDLSLTFGAAMIPLIIAINARREIKSPAFALIGAAVYLMNGVASFWLTKMKIEQDGDDAPHVGLDEEIMTYPLIFAKNKLILEPNNVDFANEHIDAEWNINHQPVVDANEKRPTVWADFFLFNFVVASVLVSGTLWPYGRGWYWLMFIIVVVVMLTLIGFDYRRSVENQKELKKKHEKLAAIKDEFSDWRFNKMRGQ